MSEASRFELQIGFRSGEKPGGQRIRKIPRACARFVISGRTWVLQANFLAPSATVLYWEPRKDLLEKDRNLNPSTKNVAYDWDWSQGPQPETKWPRAPRPLHDPERQKDGLRKGLRQIIIL